MCYNYDLFMTSGKFWWIKSLYLIIFCAVKSFFAITKVVRSDGPWLGLGLGDGGLLCCWYWFNCLSGVLDPSYYLGLVRLALSIHCCCACVLYSTSVQWQWPPLPAPSADFLAQAESGWVIVDDRQDQPAPNPMCREGE